MKSADCLCDLVARARRYQLSRAERLRLDEHLAACASCRLEQAIGADFEAVGGTQAGDDVLVARVAGAVAGRTGIGTLGKRVRVRSVWLAAAVASALVAAVAGADMWLGGRVLLPRIESKTTPLPAAPPIASPSPVARGGYMAAAVAPEEPIAAPPEAPRPRKHVRAAPVAPAPAEVDTAPSLFAKANGARRQNQAASAISLYGELERRFPGSQEATVSRVSLGRLLIDRGMSSEGLAQLDDYLTSSPNGALAPEALFAKARALEALARPDDERGVWNRLLSKFPDSVYGSQGRRRLEELR